MVKNFFQRSLNEMESKIGKVTAHKHELGLRISYTIGSEIKYLNIAGNELFPFLKKNGFIDHYAFTGDNIVKMYNQVFITTCDKYSVPKQRTMMVEVMWEDIEITHDQARQIAARAELKLVDAIIHCFSSHLLNVG